MEKTDAIAALAALAQDNRLDVYRLLVQAGPEGMPAGAVADALDLAPNTLTFHFDRLRTSGLVSVRREGRSMIYAARYEAMNGLIAFLTENCCRGAPCAPAASCEPARAETPQRSRSEHSPEGSPSGFDRWVATGFPKRSCSTRKCQESSMERLHVHVVVDDIERSVGSIRRYSRATVGLETGLRKWMLDDPRVNFAISTRGRQAGLDHLGIQAGSTPTN